jgi:hypothetical protein
MIHSVTSRIPRMDGSFVDVWCDLTDEQKQNAVNAVKEIYCNPPKTAEELHELWMEPYIKDNWKKGDFSVKDKLHPCLVPFEDLPDSEKLKDEIWSFMTELFRPYYVEKDEEASEID